MLTRRQLLAAAAVLPAATLPVVSALGACAAPDTSPRRRASAPPGRVREVAQVVDGQPVTDGAGVRLTRSLGSPALSMLDPFLMLDEFHSNNPDDYLAGFPSHPHRGFETVTYMLAGAMEHRDSMGNEGRLIPGSTQWMTAGSGIIHSEMPKQISGLMHGFQLWVNLPRAQKWTRPRYQDLPPERFSTHDYMDSRVRVVAGMVDGHTGPVSGIATAPQMIDVTLPRGGRFDHALPPDYNAFVYVVEGVARLGADGPALERGQLAVLERGAELVRATSMTGGRILLFAGRPIGEPVARRGPFVMNSDDEIREAFEEYRAGTLVRERGERG